MNVRLWIEMPVSDPVVVGDAVRPRHEIEGNVLLVYRGEKVYVTADEPNIIDRIAGLPDVRVLAPDEAVNFEATLPGAAALTGRRNTHLGQAGRAATEGRVGLGDVVSWLTGTLRMHECRACSQRRKTLNKIAVRRPRKQQRV